MEGPSYDFDEQVPEDHSLVVPSPHTGDLFAMARTVWAFQRNCAIGQHATATHYGQRHIEMFSDSPCIVIENLYMSRRDCADGAAIYDSKNGIKKMAYLRADIPYPAQYN